MRGGSTLKKHLAEYLRTQALLCQRAGVDIRLNTEVTPAYALSLKPDVIIAALGAKPLKPSIPGIDGGSVLSGEELYYSPEKAGKKVAIIGGGLVGIELAIYMENLGHEVTIVEIADKLTMHKFSVHTKALNDMLGRLPIKVKLNTKTLEITDAGLKVQDLVEGKEYFIEAIYRCLCHRYEALQRRGYSPVPVRQGILPDRRLRHT